MLLALAFGISAIVGVTLVVLRLRAARRMRPARRDLTMAEAIQLVLRGTPPASSEHLAKIRKLRAHLDCSWTEDSTARLLAIEKEALGADAPLTPIRTAIMDAMDSSALDGAIAELDETARREAVSVLDEAARGRPGASPGDPVVTEESLLAELVEAEFRCAVLRTYALVKYGDGSEHDWFDFYADVADARAKAYIGMLEQIAREGRDSAKVQAVLLSAGWPPAMAAARSRVLAARPGAPIPGVAL
jgi:hypothetical protein